MERIVNPQPVEIGLHQDREEAAYDVTVTVFEELGEDFTPVPDHENLQGRTYPYSYGQGMARFDTSRLVTDRIKLVGYFPRLNSGHIARSTDVHGESVMYDVHDVEQDGDKRNTTLIVKRRGVDTS